MAIMWIVKGLEAVPLQVAYRLCDGTHLGGPYEQYAVDSVHMRRLWFDRDFGADRDCRKHLPRAKHLLFEARSDNRCQFYDRWRTLCGCRRDGSKRTTIAFLTLTLLPHLSQLFG